MTPWLSSVLGAPRRWWSHSLPFRVVASTMTATIAILAATGVVMVSQSAQGIIEAKSEQSVSEASSVLASLQGALRDTDIGTSNLNDRLTTLAGEAASRGNVGGQYEVVIQGPVSDIGSAGVMVSSVPDSIRQAVSQGPVSRLYTTPTRIHYSDGRDPQPGLVVAGTLDAPGGGRFPVYFLFPMGQEQQTIDFVKRAVLTGGAAFVPVLAGIMYLISLQVLRPVTAARQTAERMAAGHLDERMSTSGADDLAGLARSMNRMGKELSRKINELEDLSLVQRQFVSDVSHELRTPLTTVRMAAEVIDAASDTFDPVTKRTAQLLNRELDRFEALLTELLEISRFDAGAAELILEEVDLAKVVEAEMGAQQPLADSYGSELILDAPTPCVGQVDPRRIRRIVANLISNAIEHGEGRPVSVHVRCDKHAIAIAVRDRGVGFSAAQAHQVFTRFWRADPSRTRTVGGSGLGLSISLEDAQLHGGWLNAWGRPGFGAQFRLTVPRTPGHKLVSSPWPVAPEDLERGGSDA